MWQKCPICNGTGKDPLFQEKCCTVCNGYKIVNELTGLPPVKSEDNRYTQINGKIVNLGLLRNPKNPE